GKIRVCIERALPAAALRQGLDARERARACFGELGVWDTDERCGVLVYLLLADHAIELVADRGITARVPAAQWQALVDSLGSALRDGRREAGLIQIIDALDGLLRQHFPLRAGQANPNELSDTPLLR
ncbi:MAG: TPM domain-containing protein, partial [Burkholderiales bacterium]|nr:TPM domain-containing protein [Burkholderiales bacterium]